MMDSGMTLEQIKQEMKQKLDQAALRRKKSATFHYLVLRYSEELRHLSSSQRDGLCEKVYGKKSYRAEYDKMLSLAEIIREEHPDNDIFST